MKSNRQYNSVLRSSRRNLWLVLISALLLSGCAYKINVQQGNFLDQKKIDQVEVGMTRKQVSYLLGTPSIKDAFHNNRWDYVYQVQYGKARRIIKRTVTVYFDGDKVTSVDQYGVDADSNTSETG